MNYTNNLFHSCSSVSLELQSSESSLGSPKSSPLSKVCQTFSNSSQNGHEKSLIYSPPAPIIYGHVIVAPSFHYSATIPGPFTLPPYPPMLKEDKVKNDNENDEH